MKQVEIWTDGACSPNPGAGGWGAILKLGKHEREMSGAVANSTNNQMEMTAALRALEALKEPCRVTLYSDSEYLVKGMIQDWVSKWENNNWETSSGAEPKNLDLWKALQEQDEKHNIEWEWVKGHSDNEYNNRCDELAVAARETLAGEGPEAQKQRVLGSLKQALTRLRAAARQAKKLEMALPETEMKQAKKLTSFLVRTLDAQLNPKKDTTDE